MTSRIEIIYDNTKKLDTEGMDLFHSEKEYFDAYNILQKAIKSGENKKIVTYSRPLKKWLQRGLEKYEMAEIITKELTYRDLLAKKWKIEYDINLAEAEIIKDKLLNLPLEGEEQKPLSEFIAEELLSKHLNTKTINKRRFGNLINDLLKYERHKSEYPLLVRTVLNIKLKKWLQSNEKNRELINLLIDDIESLYEKCCVYQLIKKYPKKFQVKCLTKEWIEIIRNSKINLNELDLYSFTKKNEYFNIIQNEVKIFFVNIENSEKEVNFDKILLYISGELPEEIKFILKILKKKPELISDKIILKLKNNFKPLIKNYGQEIEDLNEYKIPAYPSKFDKNWEIGKSVKWAIEEYLPYKFLLENLNKFDEKSIGYGIEFSDYMTKNYDKYSIHYENTIYRFIDNYKEKIKNTQIPIIVIFDNFNYKFLHKLKTSFGRFDIRPKTINSYVCLLPTYTEVNKKAIVSGKRFTAESSKNSYYTDFKENWGDYFNEHTIKYYSKIGKLEEHNPDRKELILINYLKIDEELHKSYQNTAIEHKNMLSFIIDEFTKYISKFITRNHLEEKTKIFFISDHGSTLINPDIENKADMEIFKKYDVDLSHRYIPVSGKKYNDLKNNKNISDEIFCISKDSNGTKDNYIIAQGYNRFKNINESFYVHGGATPEEIIVPGGFFEYQTEYVKKISIKLLKHEYQLQAKETIKFRIANSNNISINNLIINIFSGEGNEHLSEIIVGKVNGISELNVNGDVRILSRHFNKIFVKINYDIGGKNYEEEKEFIIKIKSMTQPKIDLNNF